MTSLALQLKQLAVRDTQLNVNDDIRRPSILFNPKEAASLDKEAVFAIGLSGLQELQTLNESFLEYEGTLFSDSSMGFERSVQDKETNAALDKNISSFLKRLSPYFLLRASHKAMEWLVYRYHIHQYNVDDLLQCIFPYHESKIFIRVVQLLKIQEPTHRWHWLHPAVKQGVPLARSTVNTHCFKDEWFLNFVCKMVPSAIQVHGTDKDSITRLRPIIAFFASTVVCALNAGEVREGLVAQLLPHLVSALKSKALEYKMAAYMILGQLVDRARLESGIVKKLVTVLAKRVNVRHSKEAIMCLVAVYQTQKIDKLPRKSLKHLCRIPGLIQILGQLSATYDITNILSALIDKLVPGAVHESIALSGTSSEEGESLPSMQTPYASLLQGLLGDVPLSPKLAKKTARLAMEEYLDLVKDNKEDHSATNRSLKYLMMLQKRYPVAVDHSMEEVVGPYGDAQAQQIMKDLVLKLVSATSHDPEFGVSTLALNHPVAKVREMALENLLIQSRLVEDSDLPELVLERLKDDSPLVVEAALKVAAEKHHAFSMETLQSVLSTLLQKSLKDNKWLAPVGSLLAVLHQLVSSEGVGRDSARVGLELLLLPYLYPTCQEETPLARQLLSSPLLTHSLLYKELSKEYLTKMSKTEVFELDVYSSFLIKAIAKVVAKGPDTLTNQMVAVVKDGKHDLKLTVVTSLILIEAVPLCAVKRRSCMANMAAALAKILSSNMSSPGVTSMVLEETGSTLEKLVAWLTPLLGQHYAASDGILVILLYRLITLTQLPATTKKQTGGWNEMDGSHDGSSWQEFLRTLFDLLATQHVFGQNLKNSWYPHLMTLYFKKYFPSLPALISFLSVFWRAHCVAGTQWTETKSLTLQTVSLHASAHMIASATKEQLASLMESQTTVVGSVLVALTSPAEAAREAAVGVLLALKKALKTLEVECDFKWLLMKLVHCTEELVVDKTHLQQVLSDKFLTLNTPLKVTGLTPEKASKKTSQREATEKCLYMLLSTITEAQAPDYVQFSLLSSFQHLQSQAILERLLPLLESLLAKHTSEAGLSQSERGCVDLLLGKFSTDAVAAITAESKAGQLFLLALGTPGSSEWSPQRAALKQVTRALFSALDSGYQQLLVSTLLDAEVETKEAQDHSLIVATIKPLPIPAEVLIVELQKVQGEESASTIRQAKKRKRLSRPAQDAVFSPDSKPWLRVTFILEMISIMKRVQEPYKLVPMLFTVTSKCLQLDDQSAVDYIKQLLLSCIQKICLQLDARQVVLKGDEFNIELIVQCIRTSESPQTHHHALLLLTAAAQLFPEHVLHNIMSIFTFMGMNMMKQDDSYSFQVITKTVQTVIPALIQASESCSDLSGRKMEKLIASIIQVFVDALHYVPEHRRVPLFSILLSTVGVADYLWLCQALLLYRHSTTVEETQDKTSVHPDIQFSLSLWQQFSPAQQVASLSKLLQYIRCWKDKQEGQGNVKVGPQQELLEATINMAKINPKQIRHFTFTSISFIISHLASQEFIQQLADQDEEEETSMRELYQNLLEENLRYLTKVAQAQDLDADKNTTSRFWKVMLSKAYDVLEKVNELLPGMVFIQVVGGLLQHSSATVRRKAMELLNTKLHQSHISYSEDEEEKLLALVPQLVSIVSSHQSQDAPEDSVINKQMALLSVKLLCKLYGGTHPGTFKPVLDLICGVLKAPGSSLQLTASALLCLAELCSSLKGHTIAYLPRFMPAALKALSKQAFIKGNELYLLSGLTAMHRITEKLPHFLSPYLLDILKQVMVLSSVDDSSEEMQKAQLHQRLKAIRSNVSKNISPRVLLPTISQCYETLGKERAMCVPGLMLLLQEHIIALGKDDIEMHNTKLLQLFLQVLDLRCTQTQLDLAVIDKVEESTVQAMLALVMKLSEATFRPLFYKLFDWASREGADKNRFITFYRLTDGFADKLKSLFNLFASHIVKNAAQLLNENNTSKTADSFFDDADEEDMDEVDEDKEEEKSKKGCQLLQYILTTLTKCFLYDADQFVNKDRFDCLMQPLVDQLDNVLGAPEDYEKRSTEYLSPCIGQLVLAAADNSLWKPLHYQVMLKTRNSSPRVRFAALQTLTAVSDKLKEDYATLLPEAIPFLAELMEDEDEAVEKQCQAVVSHLEEVLNEPLQKYF